MTRSEGAKARVVTAASPHIEDREWDLAEAKLRLFRPFIFEVRARREDRTIELSGNVASEQVKGIIEDIFGGYDSEALVSSLIEVTAPFRSAQPDHMQVEMKGRLTFDATAPIASSSVERYPAFIAEDEPVVGERFRFDVDLSTERNDQEALKFAFPVDWKVMAIDVDVISGQLHFGEGGRRRKIALFSDGSSTSARFEGEVTGASDEGNIDVQVIFNCEGRYSGTANKSFTLKEREKVQQPAPSMTGAPVSIRPDAIPPEMTIKIFSAGKPESWIWMIEARNAQNLGKGARHEIIDLPDAETFATSLLQQCPGLPVGRHRDPLRGIGEEIWNRSPETFRVLYKAMRDKLGSKFPIQIITTEPHVPWEMMHPDVDSGIADPDHLFLTHPICRWSGEAEANFRSEFKRGSIASFVPAYADARGALDEAIAEGKWLVSTLGANEMDPTWDSFTGFWTKDLPEDHVAILHFAGHGDNKPPRIRLLDGFVTRDSVNGAVTLGRRDGTFVVLNACEVGSSEVRLGLVSGWAENLTRQRFGGVLAPLWKVEDACASQVVRTYMDKFYRGVPMGAAMLQARKAQSDASATAFAYIIHGDVTARMV